MNVEPMVAPSTSAERRARVLSALGDPARLRVVDALVLGDLSPGELGAHLDLRSNLLAHHVGVLEREGLVVRRRSQADRRRSYLRLVPESLDGLLPGLGSGVVAHSPSAAVTRVVFVCTANSARSQLAAALWSRASRVPSTSGGTHPARAIDPGARAVARRHELSLDQTAPRLVPDLGGDDYLVTVCDSAYEDLGHDGTTTVPEHRLHWSVPDPVGAGGRQAFDDVFVELEGRVANLARHITSADHPESA